MRKYAHTWLPEITSPYPRYTATQCKVGEVYRVSIHVTELSVNRTSRVPKSVLHYLLELNLAFLFFVFAWFLGKLTIVPPPSVTPKRPFYPNI